MARSRAYLYMYTFASWCNIYQTYCLIESKYSVRFAPSALIVYVHCQGEI